MSDIFVTGTIMQALPMQQGVSQRGTQWSRQSYIIEHEHGQYPKQMIFDVSGNKIQELNLQVGENVTVHLNISMREYPQGSGKFFNSIEAWRVDRQYAQQPMQGGYQQPQYAPQAATGGSPFPPQAQTGAASFPPQQPTASPFPPQQNVQQPGGQQNLPFPPAQ